MLFSLAATEMAAVSSSCALIGITFPRSQRSFISTSTKPPATSRLPINSEISNSGSSSLYSMLGVEQNVAIPEIKRAYRSLALRFHPDVHCNASADVRSESTQKFLQLQNAYRVLSDPEQRARYDSHLITNSILTHRRQASPFHNSITRSRLRMSKSKDHLASSASWKPQWEAQIQRLRSCRGYDAAEASSGGQDSGHHSSGRTWGSRMRQRNTPNHTTATTAAAAF